MDDLLALGTFLVTLLGLGGLFLQIRSAAKAQRRDHERQRRQATLDTYFDPAAVEARARTWGVLPNDRDVSAVRECCPHPEDVKHPHFEIVIQHLNYYENLAVGAKYEVYDLDVLGALVGGRIIAAWEGYSEFVAGRRESLRSPAIWENFEWMAGELARARAARATRKPSVAPATAAR